MEATKKNSGSWGKKILIAFVALFLIGGAGFWYIMNEEYADTSSVKAAFTVNAIDLIQEFQQGDSAANKKYAEQIVIVNGRVLEIEAADTTANIKFIDTLTGSYVIFDFQAQHANDAKSLQVGDSVSLKGSCSGSIYSQLRKAHMISFKRAALNK
jgi:tRNA_anti-like